MTLQQQIVSMASRCLGCNNAKCMAHCPLGNNIPQMMYHVARQQWQQAYDVLSATNRLGAICGTVCPHRHLCEGHCVLGSRHVDIGMVEQYVACYHSSMTITDNVLSHCNIAVVGGGVSGIACALQLCSHGAHVDIFDKGNIGGVVADSLPTFRLPRQYVDSVIQLVDSSNITVIHADIGKQITLSQLDNSYDAVYLAIGHGIDNKLGITGQDKCGVLYGNQYLSNAQPLGNVVVIGGGNVAVDCARTAVRLGSTVTLAYRRTIAEMPAYDNEISHAIDEGVNIQCLLSPLSIQGDTSVSGITMQCMQLGAVGSDGRAQVVATSDTVTLPCDNVIVAVGSSMDNYMLQNSGIQYDRYGVSVDSTMHTGIGNIYAGGDIVNREGTVVHAVLNGSATAEHITNMLIAKEKNNVHR